jgi:uncharacterized SAM-binding protein YcdF (DUF218 family)
MSRSRRLAVAAAAALAALLVVLVVLHAPILRSIGGWLFVEDRLAPADAIVVLAGGTPFREATAAALLKAGWAPRIIISQPYMRAELRELLRLGIRPLDLQAEARRALGTYGVRPEQIHAITETSRTTEPELQLVRATAVRLGYRRLILVTSPEHTRRVRMIWAALDRGAPAAIVVPAEDPFPFEDWWRRRRAIESVLHEYLGVLALTLGISGRFE